MKDVILRYTGVWETIVKVPNTWKGDSEEIYQLQVKHENSFDFAKKATWELESIEVDGKSIDAI